MPDKLWILVNKDGTIVTETLFTSPDDVRQYLHDFIVFAEDDFNAFMNTLDDLPPHVAITFDARGDGYGNIGFVCQFTDYETLSVDEDTDWHETRSGAFYATYDKYNAARDA